MPRRTVRAAARALMGRGKPRLLMVSRALVAPSKRAARRLERAVAGLSAGRAARIDARALRVRMGALRGAARMNWREGRVVGQLVYVGPGGDFGGSLRGSVVRLLRARVQRISARTVWQALLDRVRGGRVDLRTALQAFSLAIRPLPGVRLPKGPVGRIPSGTLAIRWVLRKFERLSPRQRAAVTRALAPRERGRRARSATTQPYEDLAREATAYVKDLLKITPLEISVAPGPPHPLDPRAPGYAEPHNATHGLSRAVDHCHITITPNGEKFTADSRRRELAAHEVFHCLEAQIVGTLEAWARRLPWVEEGGAVWAGCDFAAQAGPVGVSNAREWYATYLQSWGTALGDRTYDAFGFFTLMQSVGINPYETIPAMLEARETKDAYESAVSGSEDAVLNRWASTYFTDPSRGAAWDTSGHCQPLNPQAETARMTLANGGRFNLKVEPYTVLPFRLLSLADIVHMKVDKGNVRISGDGFDHLRVTDAYYNTSGRDCSPGQGGPGTLTPLPPHPTPYVAVSGGSKSGSVLVEGLSIERYCKPVQPPPVPGNCPRAMATIVGTAGPDVLDGTEGPDVIDAKGGDDGVIGRGGNDVILGGAGNDLLVGGESLIGVGGDDTVCGGDGNDNLRALEGAAILIGGMGDDQLMSGAGDDTLIGDGGDDVLVSGDGADTVLGGEDDERSIAAGAGDDFVDAGDGNDGPVSGGPGNDTILGGGGADFLLGDVETIDAGNDTIIGGGGRDTLFGDAGNDTLEGKDGVVGETLDGGPDSDECLADVISQFERDFVVNCP